MGCRKSEKVNGNCRNRGVVYSLMNLIFEMVTLTIKLAFKVVEVVFQTLFGLILLITGSRNPGKTPSMEKKPVPEKNAATDNVREFKKSENRKKQADISGNESASNSEEVQNKDFYVVLFILTIIPTIVALAMGKLFYAGIIGAAGFGLMILTGIVTGIAASFKKRAAEKRVDEDEKKK